MMKIYSKISMLALLFVMSFATMSYGQTQINVEQTEDMGLNKFMVGTAGNNIIADVDLIQTGMQVQLSVDGTAIGTGVTITGDGVAVSASYNAATNAIDVVMNPTSLNFAIDMSTITLEEILQNGADAGGTTITNAGAPTNGGDLTNKTYVDNLTAVTTHTETPAAAGTSVTLPSTPRTGGLFVFFKNGVRQKVGVDYTRAGTAVTLLFAADGNDVFDAEYNPQ